MGECGGGGAASCPNVLWAQRRDRLLLTVECAGCPSPQLAVAPIGEGEGEGSRFSFRGGCLPASLLLLPAPPLPLSPPRLPPDFHRAGGLGPELIRPRRWHHSAPDLNRCLRGRWEVLRCGA